MTKLAVCPGSFDPVTLGHLDVFRAASAIFDAVRVVVVANPDKGPGLFPLDERADLVRRALAEAGEDHIAVDVLEGGLLVDYCTAHGAVALVKGVRGARDVDYELPMAAVNRELSGIETVFLPPRPEHALVSSSLVRQLAGLGGDASAYVPAAVLTRLRR
jgi:pantetheine-phosphate adenylyltransferase